MDVKLRLPMQWVEIKSQLVIFTSNLIECCYVECYLIEEADFQTCRNYNRGAFFTL